MKVKQYYLTITFLILSSISVIAQSSAEKKLKKINDKTISALVKDGIIKPGLDIKIDSFSLDKKTKYLAIFFSKELAYLPIRENWLDKFAAKVKSSTKKNYTIGLYANGVPIEALVPNYYRAEIPLDTTRFEVRKTAGQHIVNLSKSINYDLGLKNRHIAIWGGHGLYYSDQDSIWLWQRPNLFTSVEDMLTFSFVVPYIIPMLERAGANVYYPKERDTQVMEIIVDNDSANDSILFNENTVTSEGGYRDKPLFTSNENPFKLGSHLSMPSSSNLNKTDSITYFFTPPEEGDYAVYISYESAKNNVHDVHYKIYHSGGQTSFLVDQTMGYSTWVYLGKFNFTTDTLHKVVVYNTSSEKGTITTDAIKIGGGQNRIERFGSVSPLPAYKNAARYYLQYAGMPDSAVYSLSLGTNEYQDDYKSRGEWVNYLLGGDYLKNRDSTLTGLNIPLDLSIAFHTDAGATKSDSLVGTLTIHSTTGFDEKSTLPDGRSRYANRDLADIVQTEIIRSIRNNYQAEWPRRPMWDRRYSEATYPNVPSLLIELMSHQNFEDMKYGLNPEFKFDVSRAIYKGIVRYLSSANHVPYTIAPLRIKDFSMFYKNEKLVLTWNETLDPLEETAKAAAYMVYMQKEDNGFDNGTLVQDNHYEFGEVEKGVEYSFKVTAVNKGGESFDSEILSATIFDNEITPILIINGFEKLAAPEFIDTDSLGGFAWWQKSAIADGYEYSYTGNQYNFNRNDPWITNPRTGHGASYSTYEDISKAGNTFNYPKKHGKHFKRHKISYFSTSLNGFELNANQYQSINKIDLIYGKQSTAALSKNNYSIFRKATRDALSAWIGKDKSILISGAFIASDVFIQHASDTVRNNWLQENLNYSLVTNLASESGKVSGEVDFKLNMHPSARVYELRSVDALTFLDSGRVLYRYPEKNLHAAIYSSTDRLNKVIIGFPLISIEEKQQQVFDKIIKLLKWAE